MSRVALQDGHGEPVEIEHRRPLTRRERIALWNAQNGLCGRPGCETVIPYHGTAVVDEHVSPLALGGKNALTNRSLWCAPCAAEKTSGPAGDLATIAKAKRIEAKHRGTAPPSPTPLRSGRGFPRRWG